MKKKVICVFLALSLVFSISVSTSAAENNTTTKDPIESSLEIVTLEQARKMSVEQLKLEAKLAETDEQANVFFNALLDKVARGELSERGVSDTYVSITSVTQNNNAITVGYEIIARVPSGAYLELGVQYPASTRIPAQTKVLSTMSTGTYSEVFSASGIIAKQVYTLFRARDFTNRQVHQTLYMSTSSVYDYHTLTTAEVVASYTVTHVAPFVTVLIFPQSKIIKYGGIIVEAAGITYTIAGALNLTKSLPAPVVGQFYQTRTWYSGNKLYTQVKVWANEDLYDANETPMYDSGSFVAVTLPDF